MDYLSILQQYWGYDHFRGIQRQIIESIGSGHDTLGLMPTGGGKSITFQVPALAMPGVCIVITPLISLMKDQVQHLRERGIQAASIHSGMSRQEIVVTLDNCVLGGVKILYISPERLASSLFQIKLKHMRVSFITVDEAHCISQWGYDFRPSYLHIADIRRLKPDAAILALTATATPQVIDDIQEKLLFRAKCVFSMSFERQNLTYVVRHTADKLGELLHILHAVKGSVIVYVRSRRRTKEIAEWLKKNNLSATFYHAGLDHSVKNDRQDRWHNDEQRIMVATNAFGMGIDKPDVRLVIHYDCPDSIEAYFQEAGRAGRDGRRSYAVLLYNEADRRKLERRISDNFPEKTYIADVYEHLAYFYQIATGNGTGHTFTFDIDRFCRTYKYFPIQVNSALNILDRCGYIDYEIDPDVSPRVMMMLGKNELNRLDSLSPHEEAVVTALLRNYGGLFTDYVYIDEGLVAQQAGLSQQEVYLLLKGLSQRRILHFVPQMRTPYITYLRDRVDMTDVVIPRKVYEDQREQFERRIAAIISYASNDNMCRSRQLLAYFGETDAPDCGHCDVCLEEQTDQLSEDRIGPAKQRILDLLADGGRHHITELNTLNVPERQLDGALKYLVAEEMIHLDGSYLSR